MKNRAFRNHLFIAIFAYLLAVASSSAQTQAPEPPKSIVRCVTAFVRLERGSYQLQISEAVEFLKIAQTNFTSRGFTVETLRIATQPFPEYAEGLSHDDALQFFKDLDGLAQLQNVFISIGPAYLSEDDGDAQPELLADILKETQSLYGTLDVTSNARINWPAIRAAARVMKKLSDGTLHSEGNFRFAAIASVPQASPFFPAAYLTGCVGLDDKLNFAIT